MDRKAEEMQKENEGENIEAGDEQKIKDRELTEGYNVETDR